MMLCTMISCKKKEIKPIEEPNTPQIEKPISKCGEYGACLEGIYQFIYNPAGVTDTIMADAKFEYKFKGFYHNPYSSIKDTLKYKLEYVNTSLDIIDSVYRKELYLSFNYSASNNETIIKTKSGKLIHLKKL